MGQVHPLQPHPGTNPAAEPPPATVHQIDAARCALCGAKFGPRSLRYHVVPPQSCDQTMTVCRTCHNATRGEGYRPAD